MMHNVGMTDLRVRRTRRALQQALIQLTTEKGFEAITVQDLTERAEVNRATFYRHYQDKYELVMAMIKEVLDELEVDKAKMLADSHERTLDVPSPAHIHLFEHIAEHAAFYEVMLGEHTFPMLEARIYAHVEQLMQRRMALLGYDQRRARLPFDMCVSSMVSTAIGMIKWWLRHGRPYSVEQMALWLPQLTVRGLQYGLGLDIVEQE